VAGVRGDEPNAGGWASPPDVRTGSGAGTLRCASAGPGTCDQHHGAGACRGGSLVSVTER